MNDARQETDDAQVIEKTDARAGVQTGRVRYILAISTAAAVVALIVVAFVL